MRTASAILVRDFIGLWGLPILCMAVAAAEHSIVMLAAGHVAGTVAISAGRIIEAIERKP